MSTYAPDHASALADVADAGAAVTFTSTNPGTLDEATGLYTSGTTTTTAGYAVRVRGTPKTYVALSLKESEAPTLLFTPTTYGSLPSLNATVAWGGVTYTVRDVEPVAPNGTAILARVVVAR